MKKTILVIAGIISTFAIAVTPIVVYASGTNIGVISVENEGAEIVHIVGEDINKLVAWGEELNSDVADMDAHAREIETKLTELQAKADLLSSLTP